MNISTNPLHFAPVCGTIPLNLQFSFPFREEEWPRRLSDIKTILHAEVLWGEEHLDREVFSACGSDFMSDVLAFVKNQALLLTGLVNPQVVRTADMVEMKCIVFVRGKVPGPDILSLAEERDIVVMTCPKRMYEACGLLYSNGLRGNCDGDN